MSSTVFFLTLSISVASVASHASCPDEVLIPHNFHKVLKWASTGDFKV
jgi:hypothetical protein